jgi:hypothetical protein
MRILRAFRRPGLPRVGDGEVAEWLKAHAWKACLGETLTRVRIPLSPPAVGIMSLINNHFQRFAVVLPQQILQQLITPIALFTSNPAAKVVHSVGRELFTKS